MTEPTAIDTMEDLGAARLYLVAGKDNAGHTLLQSAIEQLAFSLDLAVVQCRRHPEYDTYLTLLMTWGEVRGFLVTATKPGAGLDAYRGMAALASDCITSLTDSFVSATLSLHKHANLYDHLVVQDYILASYPEGIDPRQSLDLATLFLNGLRQYGTRV